MQTRVEDEILDKLQNTFANFYNHATRNKVHGLKPFTKHIRKPKSHATRIIHEHQLFAKRIRKHLQHANES